MEGWIAALSIIFGWMALTVIVGVLAGIKKKFSLEGYLVSGRTLGMIFLYTLMAAEIYSAFAFLGTGGWAYSYGAPVLYVFAYGSLAYAFGYFYSRYVWSAGKKFGYVTQADYFMHRYGSKFLGIFTALIGIVFFVPYVQLQFQGLGYILNVGSLGIISIPVSIIIATILVLIYVYVSGLMGVAWTNLLQGILMFVVAWAILFAIPFIRFGGVGGLINRLLEVKPTMLYLHPPLGIPWYISTMVLCGLGFFIWPHLWPSIFSAKSLKSLKRTYVVLPLYSFFMLPVVLAGMTVAALGLKLAWADEAVMKAVEIAFPPWVLGIVGAAGFAAAVSTASAIILAEAGLTSSNIYRIVKPKASDKTLVLVSRIFVVVYGLIALFLAIYAPGRLVPLLLLGYSGITQMFPGAVVGMFWKRVNKWSIIAGLIAGLTTITYLKFFGPGNWLGIHFGLWGLIVNFIVVLIGTAFVKEDPKFKEFASGLKEALAKQE